MHSVENIWNRMGYKDKKEKGSFLIFCHIPESEVILTWLVDLLSELLLYSNENFLAYLWKYDLRL